MKMTKYLGSVLVAIALSPAALGGKSERPISDFMQKKPRNLSGFAWDEISRSKAVVTVPKNNRLLVQIPKDPSALFKKLGWVGKTRLLTAKEISNPNKKYQWRFALEAADGSCQLHAFLAPGPNGTTQLERTIVHTFPQYGSSTRPSSWGRIPGDKAGSSADIPGANFVANMDPGPQGNDCVHFCVENLDVHLTASFKKDARFKTDRLLEAAKLITDFFTRPPKEVKDVADTPLAATEDLQLKAENAGKGIYRIIWSARGKFKDHWVRIDTEGGGLFLAPNKNVVLQPTPAGGTTISLYAISPDGKTWHKKQLLIPPVTPAK